jgi:hypothetical protein
MAQICVPPGKEPSHVIALWRDAKSAGPREIAMEDGSLGVVLTLRREYVEEYAADSRSDQSATAYLRLDSVHQIKAKTKRRRKRWLSWLPLKSRVPTSSEKS